jgi:hypothetical protein
VIEPFTETRFRAPAEQAKPGFWMRCSLATNFQRIFQAEKRIQRREHPLFRFLSAESWPWLDSYTTIS